MSLDSDAFSREWLRLAIPHILSMHADLEFVLADRLLTYNKLSRRGREGTMLAFGATAERIKKRRNDIAQFLAREIAKLAPADRSRVEVKTWDDYADAQLAALVRILTIAHAGMQSVRECVDRVAGAHLGGLGKALTDDATAMRLCSAYVLEETAMVLRVTELAQRPFEYYPGRQIELLEALYADRFEAFGLTIESLTGRPRTRVFTDLGPSQVLQT